MGVLECFQQTQPRQGHEEYHQSSAEVCVQYFCEVMVDAKIPMIQADYDEACGSIQDSQTPSRYPQLIHALLHPNPVDLREGVDGNMGSRRFRRRSNGRHLAMKAV